MTGPRSTYEIPHRLHLRHRFPYASTSRTTPTADAPAGGPGAQFRLSILPFSHRVSLRTAELRREMRNRGLRLDHRMLDILIAGTALTYDLIMVTSDTDFDDMPDLKRLNPRDGLG